TVTAVTVTPTVADLNATIIVNGTDVTSGSASASINLTVSVNTITTVVTAQDGTTKTYTIEVTRAASSNAGLGNLVLSSGTLSPVFATGTTSYTSAVANTVTIVTVTLIVDDMRSIILVNDTVVNTVYAYEFM